MHNIENRFRTDTRNALVHETFLPKDGAFFCHETTTDVLANTKGAKDCIIYTQRTMYIDTHRNENKMNKIILLKGRCGLRYPFVFVIVLQMV